MTIRRAKSYILFFLFMTWQVNANVSCVLNPSKDIKVASAVPGVIAEHHVERGDKVQKGQKLSSLLAKIQQAQLDLATAKVDFLQRKVQRNQELLDAELISQEEADELLTDLRIAQLEAKAAEVDLNMTDIVSPISGYIVERLIEKGELVDNKPVFRLVATDPLYAEVILKQSLFGEFKLAQQVDLQLGIPLASKVSASIVAIDPIIDPRSETFGLRLQVANPNSLIPAGQKCQMIY
ncbi:efflux RND transporter periplasmic adaptor subunit [Saccharobesus litoralis]|uniref:Efflux RND transporter periplasmic adaptor subunit n=1 Tax=Saccharobesus litoralis TaxID=2172099 RepID=A0A2S0VSU0_9ALTE|nr:efflux RND transporter periplasmic adaptor subunit [Saccharobesus litoralis]AWB67267.1 efflux RND transporter periplasmic adaptor subunit [Saccharobesus litoralis]